MGENPAISLRPSRQAPPLIVYEYPLHERIRTLLRLEDLFERARHFLASENPLEHHIALLTLFEILVAVLQAYVFSLLTAVYVQLALNDEH